MAAQKSKKTPLGSGLHGDVYLIQSGSVSVVEKMVEFGDDSQKRLAFISETEILKEVSHPNIVKLIRSHIYDTKGVMFMEYARGKEVYQMLRDHGCLGEPLAAKICRSVLKALEYLHARGIVHADIKTENVIYTDETDVAVLLDFSLSFRMPKKNTRRFGTLFAMAPEMLGPSTELSPKLDIWALGIMAYEMVTGQVPWLPDSYSHDIADREIVRQIREDGVSFPDSTSDAFVSFCRSCLNKTPERRPDATILLAHPWIITRQAV